MLKRVRQVPAKLKAPFLGVRPPHSPRPPLSSLLTRTESITPIFLVSDLMGQSVLIGSFGASAVLLFGAHESPRAQPRNLVGGHLISALVAVLIFATVGVSSFSIALAVGVAICAMNLTHTTHPPGGATALIGVQSGANWLFVVVPVLAGVVILLTLALLTNNFVYHRRYPNHWV